MGLPAEPVSFFDYGSLISQDPPIKQAKTGHSKKDWYQIKDEVKFQMEYLEYTEYTNEKIESNMYIVIEHKTFQDKSKPYITLKQIKTGLEIKTKVKNSKLFIENQFKLFDILKIDKFKIQKKKKNIGGNNWVETDEDEQILDIWEVF